MAIIWVHIQPEVRPQKDDEASAKALTATLAKAISDKLVTMVDQALPPDQYTTKVDKKPKKDGDTSNAVKIIAGLRVQIEAKARSAFVMCTLNSIFEAIKAPELEAGAEWIGGGKKGYGTDGAGSDEAALAALAEKCLIEIVKPVIGGVVADPTYKRYAAAKGLRLNS